MNEVGFINVDHPCGKDVGVVLRFSSYGKRYAVACARVCAYVVVVVVYVCIVVIGCCIRVISLGVWLCSDYQYNPHP